MAMIAVLLSSLFLIELSMTVIASEIENATTSTTVTHNPDITDSSSDDYETNYTCAAICSKCSSQEERIGNSRPPGEKIPLYISAYYEGPGGGWDGSGCVPAIEMAFDDINAREDILPEYELRAIWNDTKCEAGTGSRALFDQLFREPTKIMILGGGCSTSAQALASTAHYWNLITIAYGAESPGLSNRKSYPYFARSTSPGTVSNYARIRLLKEYGWHRVATIHQNLEVQKLLSNHMHDLLKEENITLVTSETFSTNPRNQLENIKRKDAKIIIAEMYEDVARTVLCEAYKAGLTGKDYVWIINGWYNANFWEIPDDAEDIDCSNEEMKQAVDGAIGVTINYLNDPSTVTIANMTSTEYISRLKYRLMQPGNIQYNYEPYGATGYDGAWIIALVLQEAALELAEINSSRRLEDFTYNDSEMREIFFRHLADVQFEGVSGPISFINGDRIGSMELLQWRIDCLESWIRHVNDCYVFMEESLTWMDAKRECVRFGGHLAALREPKDVNVFQSTFPDTFDSLVWVGLQQVQMKWMWIDADETEESIWIPSGSSLAKTTELYCVAMNKSGLWQAMDCNASLPYICKTQKGMVAPTIGNLDIRKGEIQWISNIIWPDNEVPLDHTPEILITYKRVQSGIPFYIYVIMCSLAITGCILATSFLIFNTKFRQQRYVKMSSPNLNNIIIMGSMLIYVWVVVSGVDNTLVSDWVFSLACQIRMWLLSVGFVLAFGAMFSKTWRVYRVATLKKVKRRIITDQQLILLVTILFVIDVVILTLWQVISPWYLATEQGFERDDPKVSNQKLLPYVDYCTCSWITYWLVALCGYKGLLIIFGMFLAWETRKVQISALNDSKLIGISVYNVVILCIIGVAVSLIIEDPSTLYIFIASIVLFCTTLTLLTIFLPKIISVYKYPEGQPISTMKNNTLPSISASQSTNEHSDSTSKYENMKLRKRVVQLEEELRKAVGEANAVAIDIH